MRTIGLQTFANAKWLVRVLIETIFASARMSIRAPHPARHLGVAAKERRARNCRCYLRGMRLTPSVALSLNAREIGKRQQQVRKTLRYTKPQKSVVSRTCCCLHTRHSSSASTGTITSEWPAKNSGLPEEYPFQTTSQVAPSNSRVSPRFLLER